MLSIARGTCYSIFVYDIAFAIDLNEAERRISSQSSTNAAHTGISNITPMEVLEWIIIFLIAISIVLPFVSQNVH
jgi:hypothetical protein